MRSALKSLLRFTFLIGALTMIVSGSASAYRLLVAHRSVALSVYGLVGGVLFSGFVYVMALWSTRKPSPGPNAWGIAASVIAMIPPVLVAWLTPLRWNNPLPLLFFVGLVGIVVFAQKDTIAEQATATKSLPVAGDRTRRWVSYAVNGVSVVWIVSTISYLDRWAEAHGLEADHGIRWILLLEFAAFATSLVHECGHAIVAWVFKMKFLAFGVGPFHLRRKSGRWKLKFEPAGLFSLGGAVGVVPTNPEMPRSEDICVLAAGAFANLCLGLVALAVVLYAPSTPPGSWSRQIWQLAAFTSAISFLASVVNFFPFRLDEGSYSDGAQILQVITNSPMWIYRRTMMSIQSTLVTQRRLKDLDLKAIQGVAVQLHGRFEGLHLQMCVVQGFQEQGAITEARSALADAEANYDDHAIDLPVALHSGFVIDHALLNRDATRARLWWQRMEQKGKAEPSVDYWLARASLDWIEGNLDPAELASHKADAEAAKLPHFGAYEFDRLRCALLRQELNEARTVEKQAPAPRPDAVS